MTLRRLPEARPAITRRDFGLARLYLDDIEDIVRLVTEFVGEDGEVSLVCGGGRAIADEVEDLRQASKQELKYVIVRGDSPPIAVFLGRYHAFVEVDGDSDSAVAIADDIAYTVRRRRIRVPRSGFILVAYAVLFLSLVAAGLILGFGWDPTWLAVAIMFNGMAIGSIVGLRNSASRGQTVIVPHRRDEVRHISLQAKREFAFVVVGTVLGGVIVALVSAWLS